MPKRKSINRTTSARLSQRRSRSSLGIYLRHPAVKIAILLFVVLAIYLIAVGGKSQSASSNGDVLPVSVSVQDAYQMYEDGTFVLDVRTQAEWDEYHVPNTTLIPLDELPSRLNELPKGQPIVVVCRSGNRSQAGRDILLQAGFNATSTNGGLNAWRDSGYPIVSGP